MLKSGFFIIYLLIVSTCICLRWDVEWVGLLFILIDELTENVDVLQQSSRRTGS